MANALLKTQGLDSFPNEAHTGQWKMTISNIPDYSGEMLLYDNYIRSFQTPQFQSGEQVMRFGGLSTQMMQPNRNESLYDMSITFSATEGMENYAYLLAWWHRVTFGNYPKGTILNSKKIDFINIHQLDNQKNTRLIHHLRGGTLVSLSGYTPSSSENEIITFDLALKFDRYDFSIFDKNGELFYTTDDGSM